MNLALVGFLGMAMLLSTAESWADAFPLHRKARCVLGDARGQPGRVTTETVIYRIFADDRSSFQLYRFDPATGVSKLLQEAEYSTRGETTADEVREYVVFNREQDTGVQGAPATVEVDAAVYLKPIPRRSFVIRASDYWLCR